MKPVVWFVLAGLLCVVLAEVLAVSIMTALPPSVDVVGNYISVAVAPAVILLAFGAAALLRKKLREVSFAKALLFPATFALAQLGLLLAMGNPVGFCLTILFVTSTASVLAVLFFRRRKANS